MKKILSTLNENRRCRLDESLQKNSYTTADGEQIMYLSQSLCVIPMNIFSLSDNLSMSGHLARQFVNRVEKKEQLASMARSIILVSGHQCELLLTVIQIKETNFRCLNESFSFKPTATTW